MSLSKLSSGGGGGCEDEAFGRLSLERLLAPFQELASDTWDTASGCQAAVKSACSWHVPGTRREDVDEGEGRVGAVPAGSHDWILPSNAASSSAAGSGVTAASPLWEASGWGLQRFRAPLLELGEEGDLTAAGAMALLAAAGPAAAAAVGPGIVLCGLALNTKVLYGLLGLSMFGGAISMARRFPESQDRSAVHRAVAVMVISGLSDLALAHGVPVSIASHFAHPDVVLKFLPELICAPLVIWNVGFLSGKQPMQMMTQTSLGLMTNVCYIVSATVFDKHLALQFLGAGTVCMLKAALDRDRLLPREAGRISTCNKLRAQISADLLVFGWVGQPLFMGLRLSGCMDAEAELRAYALLDLISKLGVSHIILRSKDAFQNAVAWHQQQQLPRS